MTNHPNRSKRQPGCDNLAFMEGYTREVVATSLVTGTKFHLRVRQAVNLQQAHEDNLDVTAWDYEAQEFARYEAGKFTFTEEGEGL